MLDIALTGVVLGGLLIAFSETYLKTLETNKEGYYSFMVVWYMSLVTIGLIFLKN